MPHTIHYMLDLELGTRARDAIWDENSEPIYNRARGIDAVIARGLEAIGAISFVDQLVRASA